MHRFQCFCDISVLHKLRFLMTIRSNSSKPLVDNPSSPGTTASLIDMELLYVVIKNGILVPTAITSSVVFTAIGLVFNVIPGINMPQIIVIDCVVTSLCIFLLFSSSKPVYDRLCWSCHHACQRWQLGEGAPSKTDSKKGRESVVDVSRLFHGENVEHETVQSGTTTLSIESRAYTVSTPLGTSSSSMPRTPILTKYSSNPV
eukprot:228354_1